MAKAAPKPCTSPGCGALVYGGSSRCDAHPFEGRFADKRRGSRHERGYGTAWDKQRKVILARDKGLCQPCLRKTPPKFTPANTVDHIRNKEEGGTDDEANLQTICKTCHQDKTAEEARRGRGVGMFTSLTAGPNA